MSKVLFLISPTLNSFADKRKGTTGNKIDCASKHFSNSFVSNLQIGTVAAGAGLIGRSVVKSNISKAFAEAKALGANTASLPLADLMASKGNYFKKAKEIFKAVPTPVKVIAGALIGLSLLVRTYKKGTIEQKYIDRAQFVDHTFSLDGEGSKSKASAPLKK